MKISTKGRYALRMMVDLAQNKTKGFIPLKEISERQGISKKYLELIVSSLHNSNLLNAFPFIPDKLMYANAPAKPLHEGKQQ